MRPAWSKRKGGDHAGAPAGAPGSPPHIEGYSDLVAIGHGGSATVYRAEQDDFDRLVAIKVLHVDAADRRTQRRFSRERALGGRLSGHPNVMTVYDSGFLDGRYPYLAMEHFELGSLADRLAARGPLDVETVLHVGVRIAGALGSAHLAGIVHRDVKPQNILMSRFGEPVLADFGIAAVTEAGVSMTTALTPVHAAPELLEGKTPTPAADVFALGSTLHTLLAGSPPFAGPPDEGVLAQLLRITNSEVPPLPRDDIPAELTGVLHRAMAKQPEERFTSAAELGRALQRVQAVLGVATTQLPIETVEVDEPSAARLDEAPLAPAPPARAEERDDPTVHPRVESTVAGRHALPPPAEPERAGATRRRLVAAVVAASVIVAAGAAW
ncbi:MAG: serine/threonine-protein kinase, partial [Acidimicrobiales bacterium]